MKAAYSLLVSIAISSATFAEKPAEPPAQPAVSDAVQKAIEDFNRRKAEAMTKANEVVVVLDPPAAPVSPAEPLVEGALEKPPVEEQTPVVDAPLTEEEEEPAATVIPDSEIKTKAVLVTGKPPVRIESLLEEKPIASTEENLTEKPQPPAEPVSPVIPVNEIPAEPTLEARVESIRKGTGPIDPSQVKLKANFPAKPLASSPKGWKLVRSEQAPVFRKDVELQPGTSVTLSIRPHILAPDSDGNQTFSVGEPGFDAAQGYLQKNTVSSILGTSVAQLDQDSLQLGNAISELHRLLASLPKPPEPEKP